MIKECQAYFQDKARGQFHPAQVESTNAQLIRFLCLSEYKNNKSWKQKLSR